MPGVLDLLLNTPGFAGGTPLNDLQMQAIRRRLEATQGVEQAANNLPPIPAPQPPQQEGLLSRIGGGLFRFGNKFNTGLQSPLGTFSANLLANSGPSLTPQSTFSNLGRAALNTSQDLRSRSFDDLQRQLLESRLGLNRARETALGAQAQVAGKTNSNVQSTFEGQNGNMFIVTRDGQVRDTGVRFNERLQLVTRPDGSSVLIDPTRQDGNVTSGITPQGDESSGPIVTEVVSPEEAVSGAADVKRAETEAQGDPERERATPLQLESTKNKIGQIEESLRDLETGELDTGFFQGRVAGLTAAGQRFKRVSGQAVIEAIGQATFGQLSEGEREFLASTVANPLVDESVNQQALNEMLRILRKAQQIQEEDVQESATRRGDEIRSFEERGFTIQ